MKSVRELREFVEVTHDEISNYRRAGYIVGKRSPNSRAHDFFTRSVLELRTAKSLMDEGMQLGRAFEKAAEQFEEKAALVRDYICQIVEHRNGIGPAANEVVRALHGQLPDCSMYIEALIEEGSLAVASRGGLTLMSQFRPSAMLAYSTQSDAAFRVLDDNDRVRLRELAFDKYREETRNLSPARKLPAPLGFLKREGFSVERRVLPIGKGAFYDADAKTIILANSVRKGSPQERFLLLHEYWHSVLGHSVDGRTQIDAARLEAEATYAAVHYLIPLHTFGIVLSRIERGYVSSQRRFERLAKAYGVTESVAAQYREEVATLSLVDNPTWADR